MSSPCSPRLLASPPPTFQTVLEQSQKPSRSSVLDDPPPAEHSKQPSVSQYLLVSSPASSLLFLEVSSESLFQVIIITFAGDPSREMAFWDSVAKIWDQSSYSQQAL